MNIPPPPSPTTMQRPTSCNMLLPIAAIGLLTAVTLLWLPARAQQPPPAPDYTITLNGQEWFQIGEALADRPFKVANPILQKLNQQISAIAMQRQKDESDAAAKAKADAEKSKAEPEPKKPE